MRKTLLLSAAISVIVSCSLTHFSHAENQQDGGLLSIFADKPAAAPEKKTRVAAVNRKARVQQEPESDVISVYSDQDPRFPSYAVINTSPSRQQREVAAITPDMAMDPKFARQEVDFSTNEVPGSVVVKTSERMLYFVLGNGRALRYGVGVGRPGFEWRGVKHVSRKAEWPDWRPPVEMLQRRPDLPRFMPGGPENPLGARAMYLGSSLYRIHGTNEDHTIGSAVSSGCFRMRNDDVTDLYTRVRNGAKVIVL